MNSTVGRLALCAGIGAFTIALAWIGGQGSQSIGSFSLLMLCALGAMSLQWLAFVPAAILQTERFYDLMGGLTYIGLIVLCGVWATGTESWSLRNIVISAMVILWAVRLSSFLFRRIHVAGKDGRFDEMKLVPTRFLIPWTLQGLWVFLTALPVLILLTDAGEPVSVGVWEVIGWSFWGTGWVIEVIADRQKSAFNAQAENKGRWIDTGLWAYSQHPNYFGEILLWSGLCVSGFGQFEGAQWIALLSPVFVYVLLTRISGISLLDARGELRWGAEESYQRYRASTPVLIPWRRGSR
jgi:steroid 5-alpha reductase family enzyme